MAERLERTLRETLGVPALAQHIFARLGDVVIRHEHPMSRLADLTDATEPLVDRCVEALEEAWPDLPPITWKQAEAIVRLARELLPVAERGQLALLDGVWARAGVAANNKLAMRVPALAQIE